MATARYDRADLESASENSQNVDLNSSCDSFGPPLAKDEVLGECAAKRKEWEESEELSCRMSNQSMIDDYTEPQDTETVEKREKRKGQIKRNLHNQRTYYEQRNNFDSDEASDLQSEIDSNGEHVPTYDEKMRALVKMFIQSFVPFHLIHGSYFQNLLRNTFGIRKMPKLVQFKNFFTIMHELATKYITQTISGAQSYTLIFEFWKTPNRRHQFLTIRGSYIDVFVRRSPILANFKVFHDWSSDKYIDRFNMIFKRFSLQRDKVFAVVTNFKSRQFLSAIETYIGNDKVVFCLVHQFNCKFNELLLDYDYEEDKIHYEEKLPDFADQEKIDEQEEEQEQQQNFSDLDEENAGSGSGQENEANDEPAAVRKDLEEEEAMVNCEDLISELNKKTEDFGGDDEEEPLGDEEDALAYIKLVEEPSDILKILNKRNPSKMNATVRVVYQLLKLYATIASNRDLLNELNEATKKSNGYEFHFYYLLAYRNWNYLHQFLFYFRMTKPELLQFLQAHSDELKMPLSEHDQKIVNDVFDLLSFLVKKMNMLSLEESIGLGKAMNVTKYFTTYLPKLDMYTEQGRQLKQHFLNFFRQKHGFFERDNLYGIASLLDPKSTKYDFKTDHTFKQALRGLHDMLCLKLDKNFNLTMFRIRAPLRIELENFHKHRPYRGQNEIVKFQMNSPVLQKLVYDYLTLSAICFEPKKIDFEVKERIHEVLSQCRSDTLSQVMLLNSLDEEVLDQIINYAKFWY